MFVYSCSILYVVVYICHLEAGELAAVVYALRLNLGGLAVQMSTVQSFQPTLVVPEPSLDFLLGHGSGQVLTLRDNMTPGDQSSCTKVSSPQCDAHGTSTTITPPALKRYGASGASRFRGNSTGFG